MLSSLWITRNTFSRLKKKGAPLMSNCLLGILLQNSQALTRVLAGNLLLWSDHYMERKQCPVKIYALSIGKSRPAAIDFKGYRK